MYNNIGTIMIKRSGVEEEVSEMDDLLNHVVGLSREFALLPSVKGKSQANSHQESIAIRENALINLFDDTSTIDVNEEIIESEGPKNNEEPGPSYPEKTRKFSMPNLTTAYKGQGTIKEKKYKDLEELCNKDIIPSQYHLFYKLLLTNNKDHQSDVQSD
ncbi:unnamed protein product [Diabrotica balteata]|uniref:Uncharacterized protein n=1 Tax=Diabrotica balteata TaxID=107213 RepID=A0A9N9X7Y9_DIABA|nr:unnamed protein product [Diabrotica balteata]